LVPSEETTILRLHSAAPTRRQYLEVAWDFTLKANRFHTTRWKQADANSQRWQMCECFKKRRATRKLPKRV
jgi:hypothetical protein